MNWKLSLQFIVTEQFIKKFKKLNVPNKQPIFIVLSANHFITMCTEWDIQNEKHVNILLDLSLTIFCVEGAGNNDLRVRKICQNIERVNR